MKIAAVYVRVSTDDQAELSPDSQLSMIRSYAASHGILIPEEYIFMDEGISGRSAKNRPEFNRMIGTAKQQDHPIDVILLWKFSRFARNQEESIVYKAMLRKSGVEVVSVSEPIIDGPFGTLIERIIEWMDEYYSIRLSGEVKRSMTVNAQRGTRQTAPPFGYVLGPKDGPFMVPEPQEAEIIRECFSRYAAGEAVWAIVHDFNSRGIRTHRGGVLENRTLMYWLQNPVYIGKNRWTPSGKTRRDFSNPDTLIVDGDHDALISEDLFAEVQERIRLASEAHRPKSRPSFELKDWMGGVVRCATCGATLVFCRPHNLICNNHVRGSCPDRQMIVTDHLHDAVIEKLHADLDSTAPLIYSTTVLSSDSTEEKSLSLQISQVRKRLQRSRDAYTAGIDTLEEYRTAKQLLDRELSSLQERLADLSSRKDPKNAESILRENIRCVLETLESPDATKEEKNEAVKGIFETCTWNRATLTLSITYRVFI